MATIKLDDITAGAAVFIDAYCLICAFDLSPHQSACRKLLDRIEHGDIQGFTSAHVFSEASHRLMTAQVRPLSRHRQAIDELTLPPMTILSVTGPQVSRGADLSIQHGLLTNNALIIVAMLENGLTHLASNDADFDRVPGITRFAPI